MKKYIICICSLCFIFLLNSKVGALSDCVVEKLSVNWTLEENGFMRVYETYKVKPDSQDTFKIHIPTNKQISWDDIREESFIGISDVKVVSDHTYQKQVNMDGYTFTFDNSNKEEEYVISYLVKLEEMYHNDQWYIFYDMVGNRIDGYIKSMDFVITLPEKVDTINIRIPKYAGKEDKGLVTYVVNENTIIGSYENLTSYATIQVLLEVDEDYIQGINYDVINYIVLSICFVLVLIAIIVLNKKGDFEESETLIDTTIMNELNSMEVNYLHQGYSDARGVVSLFLMWAQKGYIQLEYLKDKKNIIFHKKNELSIHTKEFEKDLFQTVFAGGNDVRMKTLLSIFGRETRVIQRKMRNSFKYKRKVQLSMLDKIGLSFICALPIILVIGMNVFMHTFSSVQLISIVGIYFVVTGIFVMYMLWLAKQKHRIFMLISMIVYSIVIFYLSQYSFGDYVRWDIVLMAQIISMMLVYAVCNIKFRSEYADYLLKSIHGLKMNIQTVKDPKLAEEVFAYAYALNMEYELYPYIDTVAWFICDAEDMKEALEVLERHIFKNIIDNRHMR